jgi:hypothetical protein
MTSWATLKICFKCDSKKKVKNFPKESVKSCLSS